MVSSAAAFWLPWVSGSLSLIFLLILPFNLWHLYRAPVKVQPSWHGRLKAAGYTLYVALQFALLILHFRSRDANAPLPDGVVISSLQFVAALGLLWLSVWAHWTSLQPSNPAIGYLLAKLACYMLWITVPGLYLSEIDWVLTPTQICFALFLLWIECRSKDPILRVAYRMEPPEAATSFLGRVFFSWINPVLVEGYNKVLVEDDLPALDRELSSKSLRQGVLRAWDQRAKPETSVTLPTVLLRCLIRPFLSVVIPRLCLIAFRFAQPILIGRAVRFVMQTSVEEDDEETGYWIVVAASTIYLGLAVSTSVYQHGLNRLEVMIRGTLVGLIHSRSSVAQSRENDEGKAVTLMSNDVNNLEESAAMFHETWAQVLEVMVGMLLLARQVGWVWPLPLFFIFLCSQMSRWVARHLKSRQGMWNMATQERISTTGSMLGAIKNIKMLGVQEAVSDHILEMREEEIEAAKSVRWMMIAYNASANALGMFTPVLTIVLYAAIAMLQRSSLDTETAFTTVAILAMVTHPANMVFTIVPRAIASFSSFERIQAYLMGDARSVWQGGATMASALTGVAIRLTNVSIVDKAHSRTLLRDVNLEVPCPSVVICTGPVGSGKTTLIRAILGEASPSKGDISVSSSKGIAYCAQSPWLPNQTIKDIVHGPLSTGSRDEAWYHMVLRGCCLDQDIDLLPDGDETVVGSKGMNLSGGQRQRVALARAVYSRGDVVILDDSFSALDGKTQAQVIENLLGPEGLLRTLGAAIFWITNSTRHLHLADEIVVLADGTVKERGTWDELRGDVSEIEKMIHPVQDSATDGLDESKKTPSSNRTDPKPVVIDGAKDVNRKNGDLSLYSYYFEAAGVGNILLNVSCAAIYSFFFTFPQYWLKWWTESDSGNTVLYMVGYLLIVVIAYGITNVGYWCTLLRMAPTSGLVLHSRLLSCIMGAPLLYFSGSDTGILLNRFSQDIQLVDKQLASATATLGTQIFKLLMQACLLFASQPLMTISLPLSAAVVYVVQKVYLRTSRQLRFLELESRSAVYSSFLETIQGIATIRAFGWQRQIAKANIETLDKSQRPFYLLICLQRWLNVVLDLLIASIAVGTIYLAVHFRGSTTGGQVGVALNIILVANTTLLKLVQGWTDLEISLGAVARLKEVEYDTPKEEAQPRESNVPPESWPSSGTVEFHNVTAAYNPSSIALESLDLNIAAGQTVVVCGRTGSGKSSLLLSLLRLLDLNAGAITIDGIDTAAISRSTLRKWAFITVAQDAFFLPDASLGFNLDPHLGASGVVLAQALHRTGLWSHFAGDRHSTVEPKHISQEDALGIVDKPLSSLPALSAGQSQLLALARALVRKTTACGKMDGSGVHSDVYGAKPVVLLDEVTASLDPGTEAAIYDIIQEEFVNDGHTVIMVTHKLGGFACRMRPERDMVVWMKDGVIERIDTAGNAQH